MTLDMSEYKPYAKMGKTCKTRVIRDKRIVWPLLERDVFDGEFRFRPISRKDIDEAAELWKMCYPEAYGSPIEWPLYPDQYESKVAFRENWEEDSTDKIYWMQVMEDTKDGKLIGICVFTKVDKNLQIECSFGGLHPDYREGKAGVSLVSALNDVIAAMEESGAEYLTAYCETWHNITQYLCLKQLGFKIAGIFPGQYTRWAGENREYRGCEVHFYKLVGDGEKYATKPAEWRLSPEVKELWEIMERINNGI